MFCMIPYSVGMVGSSSVGHNVIGLTQSKTTCETLRKKVVVTHFASANDRLRAGDDPELDPTVAANTMEMKREAEQQKFHPMAKVHDFLEIQQCSQNLQATWKASCPQNKQMTAVGYISDTEEIIKATCTPFQYDCAAVF